MAKTSMMITCDKATLLMSEGQDRPLRTGERTVLRVHTWMCSNCRQFGKQLGFIRQAMTGFAQRDQTNTDGDNDDQPRGNSRG